MRTFLVTGGAGFIGSHIAATLVERGDRVRVLDNLSTGFVANMDGFRDRIEFIKGDVTDADAWPGRSKASIASSTRRRWRRCRRASSGRWIATRPARPAW